MFGTWIRHIPNIATTFATDPICLSFLAIYISYFIMFEGTVGATAGKLVCKIKVKKENGDACGIYKAFIRNNPLLHSPINKLSRTYPHAFSQLYEVES